MNPVFKKTADSWQYRTDTPPETFWASYSDMMACLLMIFALTTVITLMDIGKRLVEPTKVVQEWEQVVDDICNDQDLEKIKSVKVDCRTGALVISEESLRFGFGKSDLGGEAINALRLAVPKYFEIIHRYPQFMKRIQMIEISGHTDKDDTGQANPYISRRRAGQVLEFLLSEPSLKPFNDLIREKAVTAGYAATRFPKSCQNKRCGEARRVEISIKLSETDVLREFVDILRKVIQ